MKLYSMFNTKELSDVWPSDNPKDIPFTEYVCKICGHEMVLQSCGSYYPGHEPTFEERINKQLREHLLEHCQDEFLFKIINVDLLTANIGFDNLLIKNIQNI